MSAGTKITGMRLTEDTLAELRAVAARLAEQTGEPPNLSAAARYAIRQAFLAMKKTSKSLARRLVKNNEHTRRPGELVVTGNW